jgi:adsorption protein B
LRANRKGLAVGSWGDVIAVVDAVARETLLFAAIGFLIGGLDDFAIDLVYIGHRLKCHLSGTATMPVLDDFLVLETPGRIAVFIAAWDESAVIGAMLRNALASFDHPNYRLYVGAYPNDPATIDAVAEVAEHDARVVLVIGDDPGPTTKADCLNAVWRALLRDEHAEGVRAKAIVLHDAEDLVHAGELRIYDALIDTHWVVQLPVHPLIHPQSLFVSGQNYTTADIRHFRRARRENRCMGSQRLTARGKTIRAPRKHGLTYPIMGSGLSSRSGSNRPAPQ